MDLRNYGVIDFAEHVQLDGMWSAKNKALHEQVDSLNKQLKGVRDENQRYFNQIQELTTENFKRRNEFKELLAHYTSLLSSWVRVTEKS